MRLSTRPNVALTISSKGKKFCTYNRFVQALDLQRSAFAVTTLFHCGPEPMCSMTKAYQNTTASNAGESLNVVDEQKQKLILKIIKNYRKKKQKTLYFVANLVFAGNIAPDKSGDETAEPANLAATR